MLTPNGYGVDENADDIAALIQSLAIEKYTLVGHSMGGKIALALAARAPVGKSPRRRFQLNCKIRKSKIHCARMNQIRVPVLEVAGEMDAAMTPQRLQNEVVVRIAGAQLETVAGAAHLLPLEKPAAVAALIRRENARI